MSDNRSADVSFDRDAPQTNSGPAGWHLYSVAGRPQDGGLDGTIIVEADSAAGLEQRLQTILASPGAGRWQLLALCHEPMREAARAAQGPTHAPARLIPLASGDGAARLGHVLEHARCERVAFLPPGALFGAPRWEDLHAGAASSLLWVPEVALPEFEWAEQSFYASGWIATADLLRPLAELSLSSLYKPLQLAAAVCDAGRRMLWTSPRAGAPAPEAAPAPRHTPALNRGSSTLALVPHYRCEEWLGECLESLVTQSRPLAGIAVIDDGSARPPSEIVERFPQVTLLAAERNVGPYRLMQAVIDATDYDAYLFQDADDWSSHNRLELLLSAAECSGAEWVGSQELRIMCDEAEVLPVCYPLDVNGALEGRPGSFCLLNGTSLLSARLFRRLGGFATGLRFAADMELLQRAAHVARVVNIPHYCYFRRYRAGSVTLAPETGHGSAVREEITRLVLERALDNAGLRRAGEAPNLAPLSVAEPARLTKLLGPDLRTAATA